MTGKLLNVGSRLQTYFLAQCFRNENPISKPKKGAVVLVGCGDGNMNKAYDTACALLKHINVTNIFPVVCSHNTNIQSALEDEAFINQIAELVAFFNTGGDYKMGDYKNGQWDLGAQAKDNLHFPLSDLWRKPSDRINDCTYRIEKIIMNIS